METKMINKGDCHLCRTGWCMVRVLHVFPKQRKRIDDFEQRMM